MPHRYLSLLRPLGSWVSLDQIYTIEEPLDSDVDPFRLDWHVHSVLVTEDPLPKEKIQSLQLTDLHEVNRQKALSDLLDGITINVKAAYVETCIKNELGVKIIEGKIKNETVLRKLITKYEKQCNGTC